MSKRHNKWKSISRKRVFLKKAIHRTHLIETLNATLFKGKLRTYRKKRTMAKTVLLHTRRNEGRRESMVRHNNNSRRSKTTVALATKETTMTQKCKTSKSHHIKNVVDSRNRSHHTMVVATEQTSYTIGREETTAKWQSCKNSLWCASMSEALTEERSNTPLVSSFTRVNVTLSAWTRPS